MLFLLWGDGGKDCRVLLFHTCRMAVSIFAAHSSHARMKSTAIVVAGRLLHTSHSSGLGLSCSIRERFIPIT